MKNYLNLFCVILFSLITQFALAQNQECDGHIREASENFKIGDFNKVIEKLTPCVERPDAFSKKNYLEDAYVLLASTFIAKDSMPKAREYVELLIDLNQNFQTRSEDLLLFRRMVEDAKRGDLVAKVSSVSKVSENLYEAPASVILITEEEIKRRGYSDLEALLHDLPGFDISRSNGILYSNIYQRGYRSNNTNRMLLLVDGVEENDLWGNIVYLSRQYPLSNIKSVEVIYGPASTIYGANAYAGVISINTKNPLELVNKDSKIGLSAEAGYGSWNTRYADATVAVAFPNVPMSLSVTGRVFQSDEPNFGNEPFNDFGERSLSDPFTPLGDNATFQNLFEYRLNITDNALANTFYQTNQNSANANYFQLNVDGNGDSTITLTDEGLTKVNDIENTHWNGTNYSDKTNAYALAAKMQFGNLMLGWQYWAKEEGVGVWFNDVRQGGTNEGQFWSPYSNFFYAKFNTRLSNELNFTSFTRYKVHGYLESNKLVSLQGYSNGSKNLTNLLDDEAISFGEPFALTTRSNQIRSENRLIYTPSSNFSLVSGFEIRYSAIQDNYATVSTDGTSSAQDHFFFGDVGVYSQARYQINDVTLTGGLRYDYNKILDTIGFGTSGTGYGSQLNPRLAVVYHPDQYVFKAIFATAFKDATNFDRYSTVSEQRDLPNPSLQPERVLNYEVSARRFLNEDKRSSIELVGYFADYSSVISTKTVGYKGGTTTRFENTSRSMLRRTKVILPR